MSALGNRVYSDEHIERWTAIYHANNLRARNILLDTFLEAPGEILRAVRYWAPRPALPTPSPLAGEGGGEGESDYLPLLPRQLAVAMRLRRAEGFGRLTEAVEAEIERRIAREHVIARASNGAQCEVMRHHRNHHRRGRNAMFLPRGAQ